jgi:CDP-glycerol glycerophosphotransferase
VFDICFNTKNIIEAGYSRNDCLLSPELEVYGLLSMNVDQKARHRMVEHRRCGGRVVLYAPTYRDDFRSPFDDGSIDLSKWAEAAGRNNMLLVLKLHPEMLGRTPSITDSTIVHIEPSSDIYPLLREVDLLVSDYSSIHFDFLLMDRPIVFFPYDLSRYISENRPLMFDYDSMTPGPKAHNFTELLSLIQTSLGEGKTDAWKAERDRVRDLAFDHIDCHASERIWMKLSGKDSCTA